MSVRSKALLERTKRPSSIRIQRWLVDSFMPPKRRSLQQIFSMIASCLYSKKVALCYWFYLHGVFEGKNLTGSKGELDLFQSFYFSAVTMSTFGYGDFVPTSTATRLCAIFQSLLGIILMITFIACFHASFAAKVKKLNLSISSK